MFQPVLGLKVSAAFLLIIAGGLASTCTLIALFVLTVRRFRDPESLRRASSIMALLVGLGAVVIPLSITLGFLFPDEMRGVNIVANRLLTGAVPFSHRCLALTLYLLPMGFKAWALYSLRALFLSYARGHVFSSTTVHSVVSVAASLFASVISKLVIQIPLSYVLSMHRPPGQREVSFGIGADDIGQLFWAGVILIIALVMREAQKTADENASIV